MADDDFRTLMVRLDMALTGKDAVTAERNAAAQKLADALEFVLKGREYHLSDGGYSRVVVTEEGRIFLTSNSRDEVRRAWDREDVRRLAGSVSASVGDAVARETGKPGPT